MTYLYERDDFGDLIEAAASFHGIASPAIVEKDYLFTSVRTFLRVDLEEEA